MARKKPEPADATAEPDKAKALRITSAREGFRRAGRAWSTTPTEVPVSELTDEQVAMLMAEPMLTIEEIAG